MVSSLLFTLSLVAAECGQAGLGPVRPGEIDRIDLASYAVVERLVAADGAADADVFAAPLASRLRADGAPEDWLTGGGSADEGETVGLHVLNRSGLDRTVLQLGFANARGQTVYRRFHMSCIDGRWRITDVYLSPEGAYLSEIGSKRSAFEPGSSL